MKTLIVYPRRCHDVAESLLWINKMVRPSPFQSICDLLAHTFSTNSIPATAKIPIIGRPRIEKQVECRRLVDGVHEVSKASTSQKMVFLELAVLALARIMCAYIHSQNGSAILAQA